MSSLIPAIYENGIIRPLQPLHLLDGQEVQIQIVVNNSQAELQSITQSLEATGIITPPPHMNNVEPVDPTQWQELAERLQSLPGKPLSEIIIEERGAW
ncbi:MAG: antitoxin family protein [Leptolyngbyaceae cyanobacterium bins.349]|nr:antitoxin family protein [Leptolyngbyaceae cyanobacterium bins.349]